MNIIFKFNPHLKYLTILLLALYPLDQLHTTIFQNKMFYSPYKILIGTYLIFFFQLNGLKNTYNCKSIFLFLFSLVIISFLSILWAHSNYFFALKYSFQLLVLCCFTIVAVKLISNDETALKDLIFYSVLVSGFVSLFGLFGFFTESEITFNKRISFEQIGLNSIAISTGYSVILGLFGLKFFKKNIFKKILIFTAILIDLWFIFRLGTRSVIWGLIAIFFFLSLINISFQNILKILILVFLIILSLTYISDNEILSERILSRITNINFELFYQNDRIETWLKGIKWWSMNILGSGAGNEIYVYKELKTENLEAHNTLVSSLIQLGPIGFLFIISVLFLLVLKTYSLKKSEYFSLYVALFLFLTAQMLKGSFLQTRLFWQPLTFLLIFLSLNYHQIKNKTKKKE